MAEKRRRNGRKRQAKRTIFIVTNGEVTEKRYLDELKQRALKRISNVAITVKVVPGEPVSVLKKLANPQSDTSAYDEVWFIFDEDGQDRSDIYAECARRSSRRQNWYAVVTRPCFEAWLVAHYEQVGRYTDQANAQAHFRRLVGKEVPEKELPRDFPYDAVGVAVGRSCLPNDTPATLGEMPPSPGSGMPHLVERLGLTDH